MTRIEQHNMVETLKDYLHKMKPRDLDDFEMLRKRDRDDEDLDISSRQQLTELFVRYVPARFR